MDAPTAETSRTAPRTGEDDEDTHAELQQRGLYVCEVFGFFFLLSYGECVIPNKELNKSDSYHGHWRDGKIHGFGKYKSGVRL